MNLMNRTLFFWPNLTRFNPYQSILYTDLRDCTVSDQVPWQGALQPASDKSTFHLHWEQWVYRGLKTSDEVELAIHDFLTKLVGFICRGGGFVWTIHNEEPHENLWPRQHAALQESLASLSHKVIVHSNAARNIYAAKFPCFAHKILVVRHPSYQDYLSKICPTPIAGLHRIKEVTFLFFGQIREYKGLDFVLTCLSEATLQEKPWRLVIAGEGPIDQCLDRFYTGERRRLVLLNRRVSDGEVKYLAGIADVALFAFQKILSSGSVRMIADLDLPMIAPAFPSLQEEPGLRRVCWFAPGEAVSFIDAVGILLADDTEAVRQSKVINGDESLSFSDSKQSPIFKPSDILANCNPSGGVVIRRSVLQGRLGCVILCWPSFEAAAQETQRQILETGVPCHVIYSESHVKESAVPIPGDWVKIPDDWFYGRKLKFVLEFFNFDTLLQVQADATHGDWGLVVKRLHSAFNEPKEYQIGVWAPDVDYTFWKSPCVDVGRDARTSLRFVMQTDTTCWALAGDVQKFLRSTPLVLNNTGWGVDWAATAFAYTTGKSVCRDETLTITHPKGSNYGRGDAALLEARYIGSLPVPLQVQIKILNELARARISASRARDAAD